MQTTYRDILKQAFQDRSSANPSYSARAFARDLKIPTSTLSEVLNGKKGISPQRALHFAKALKLPGWQEEFFCDLVTKEHAKSPRRRLEAKERLRGRAQENQVHLLSHQALRALTSWVDLAILELTYLPTFQASPRWIAQRLGVEVAMVAQSVNRLKEAKLLKVEEKTGAWRDASPLFSTTDGVPSDSIRHFHGSVLRLALEKLAQDDVGSRTVKTAVFSISANRVPLAKKILDEAIAKIVSLADESAQERTDVMCFSAQLFSLLSPKGNP